MNKNRYRVIYNQNTQQMVAVSEATKAQGKGNLKCDVSVTGLKLLLLLAASLIAQPLYASTIIADPKVAKALQPTVIKKANKAPTINIVAPSGKGVSHNRYQQFDVSKQGVILNNTVKNNPNLKQSAKVILNEVNSNKASLLNGLVTVQGSKASVIIANPSGLSINGLGFVNADKVTLTTGKPVLRHGALDYLDIKKGHITITGTGLNAKQSDYAALLSRAITLQDQAEIQAKELLVATGSNQFFYETGVLKPTVAHQPTRPIHGIDTAALGGMYADSITLVATEQGIGVRHAGTLQATDTLILTAAGTLTNLGQIKVAGTSPASLLSIRTTEGDLVNQHAIESGGAINMHAAGNLNLAKGNVSQSNTNNKQAVSLSSGKDLIIGKDGHSVVDNQSQNSLTVLSAQGLLTVGSHGQVNGLGEVVLASKGDTVLSSQAKVNGGKDVAILAQKNINASHAHLSSGQKLHIEAAQPGLIADDKIQNNINIKGGSLSSARGTVVRADQGITLDGADLKKTDALHMVAESNVLLKITKDKMPNSFKDLSINARKNIKVQTDKATILSSKNNVSLTGSAIASSYVHYAADKNIQLTAHKGNINLATATQLTAGQHIEIASLGGDVTATNLNANAKNGHASIHSHQHTRLKTSKVETLTDPMTKISGKAGVSIGSVGQGELYLGASELNSSAGNITLSAGKRLQIDPLTATVNQDKYFAASQITGQNVVVHSGLGDVDLALTNLKATKGDINIVAQGSNHLSRVKGKAEGNISTHADKDLTLNLSELAAGNHLTLSAGQTLNHNRTEDTQFQSEGSISVVGGFFANRNLLKANGILASNSKGHQYVNKIRASAGAINIKSDQNLSLASGVSIQATGHNLLKNHAKLKAFNGDLNVESKGALIIKPEHVIKAAGNMTVRTKGDLTLTGIAGTKGSASAKTSRLTAGRDLNLVGKSVKLQAAALNAGGTLTVVADAGQVQVQDLDNTFVNQAFSKEVTSDLKQRILNAEQEVDLILNDEHYKTAKHNYDDIVNKVLLYPMVIGAPPGIFNGYLEALNKLNIYTNKIDKINDRKKNLEQLLRTAETKGKGNESLGSHLQAKNIRLTASNAIDIAGAKLQATNKIDIKSGGAKQSGLARYGINVSGVTNGMELGQQGSNDYQYVMLNQPSELIAPNGIHLAAYGPNGDSQIHLGASSLVADKGDVTIQALGNVHLLSGTNEYYKYRYTSGSHGNAIKKTKWTKSEEKRDATAAMSQIQAQNIRVLAGDYINAYATEFSAPKGRIHLTAGQALSLYAVDEIHLDKTHKEKKSKYAGVYKEKGSSSHQVYQQSQLPTTLIAKKVKTESGWDTILEGTQFNTLQGAHIQAGVGEKAKKDAKIILKGIKDSITTTSTSESKSVLWQREAGKGQTKETLTLPSFEGPVAPTFTAPGGFVVDVPAGDLKTELAKLLRQPELAYLKILKVDKNTDWRQVDLAYEQWNYSQNGLSPAGAALVALAVTVATYGAGSGVGAGVMTANAAGASSVVASTTASAVANAAFASLASQAAISVINHGGDLNKVFKDLGSKDTAKGLATAIVTAGVADKLGFQYANSNHEVINQFTNNLIQASTAAVVSTTINGGDWGKALEQALLSSLVQTAHGQLASKIKLSFDGDGLQKIAHKVAHAVAGCAAAAANKGKCQDGAIGAAVGEIMAEQFPRPDLGAPDYEVQARKIIDTSKLVAATVVTLAGGNPDVAASAAKTAVEHNMLLVYTVKNKLDNTERKVFDLLEQNGAGSFEVHLTKYNQCTNNACRKNASDAYVAATVKFRALVESLATQGKISFDDYKVLVGSLAKKTMMVLDEMQGRKHNHMIADELAAWTPGGLGYHLRQARDIARYDDLYYGQGLRGQSLVAQLTKDERTSLMALGYSVGGHPPLDLKLLSLKNKPPVKYVVPNSKLNDKAVAELKKGKLPGSTSGGLGSPRSMPDSTHPDATANDFAVKVLGRQPTIEEYAKGADITFNGKSCIGCWVGFDAKTNTYITYRPAGMASGSTAPTTATIQVNSVHNTNAINVGKPLKLKFPEGGQ